MSDKYYNSKSKEYFQIISQDNSGDFDIYVFDKNETSILSKDVFKRRCFPVENVSSFLLKSPSKIFYKIEIFDNSVENDIIDFKQANNLNLMLSFSEKNNHSSTFDLCLDKSIYEKHSDIEILQILNEKIFKKRFNLSIKKNNNNKKQFLLNKKTKSKINCHLSK